MNLRFLIICVVVVYSGFGYAQNSSFNKLELYYSQGHYKKVYKLSSKLLDKPENDYSKVPAFYHSLSIFQLTGNKQWSRSRPNAFEDAKTMYLELMKTNEGQSVIESHLEDVTVLKQDLTNRIGDLQRGGKKEELEQLQDVVTNLLKSVPVVNDEIPVEKEVVKEEVAEFSFDPKNRDEIVLFAKQQLGKPYVYAGSTPTGFDCSGFTSYIFSAYKVNLPRRSSDQYDQSKKVKESKVKKGDLVFFDNGNGVNHVGMIISEAGESPVMIHSSSSKGIIITDIRSSEYWNKRLKGFGTFID